MPTYCLFYYEDSLELYRFQFLGSLRALAFSNIDYLDNASHIHQEIGLDRFDAVIYVTQYNNKVSFSLSVQIFFRHYLVTSI